MSIKGLQGARRAGRVSSELIRYRRWEAPAIAAKLLIARGVWGIEASRFLMCGMQDQRMKRWSESMSYLGDLEPGLRTINWQGDGKRLTVDKLAMAERFAQAGVPCAPLIAVIGRDSAAHPHQGLFPVLSTSQQIVATLAAGPERLFVKPADGWRGDGVLGPERCEGGWNVNAATLSSQELADRLLGLARPAGLLLQRRVASHRGLAPIGGNLGLGTVRINTALTSRGAEVVFVFGKIMGAKGLVDNFSGGKFGNMLAAVDIGSGRIMRVFGRHPDQRFLMERVLSHPVTGMPLLGFRLPLWSEAVALAKRTAESFPEAPLIGADVALTDDGPLIIEVQSDWDANAPQLILGRGLRPLLREIVPRLALSRELKELAMREMHLAGSPRGPQNVQRPPRN